MFPDVLLYGDENQTQILQGWELKLPDTPITESSNNTKQAYVLKCDIRKYFASIDHEILLSLIDRHIQDDAVLELIRTIILSHGAESGKGIPLGNISSQLFANVYLHELDWFVKQTLEVKQYIRYCDDFVIVSQNRAYLENLIALIRNFLKTELQLDLHPSKVSIRSWRQGIDFLGYVLLPHATVVRTKTQKRIHSRVNAENYSSYLGVCSLANAYRLSQTIRNVVWTDDIQ